MVKFDKNLSCFKAYDIRGKLGEELDEKIAYRIGRATAQSLDVKTVVLGFDARKTSPRLAQAVALGVCDFGADVLDIGFAGTEEVYSAVSELDTGAGIMVTASHNPISYNGMKLVKRGSKPLTEFEFSQVKQLTETGNFLRSLEKGSVLDLKAKARRKYLRKITGFVNLKVLKPIKIVINSGNGAAGPIIDELEKKLRKKGVKTNFKYVHHNPDPAFPNGIPNPLLEENRSSTANAVIENEADFGVAFDGDFDRCFLFDHLGNFIPGEYVVGLLAEIFLRKENRATIIHDPRVVWNTIEIVRERGGNAIASKTGHAFVKAAMRDAGAIYGGEMSAHHYFKEFDYCDSGMIPWLLIWEILSQQKVSLSDLIAVRKSRFPSSGEINFTVKNATDCIEKIKQFYSKKSLSLDELDGLSISFETWRFNVRQSNTEPLVRLNLETRGDELLLTKKTEELKDFILNR